jgi:AcrR family transcriptional regulator
MEGQPAARERLLGLVVEHFTAEGLGDQSLRRIAEGVGTSHRMLLYHFESKDGLLLAVAQEVERRTRSQVEMLSHDATASTDDHIRRVWAYVADPALAGFERLFFALYGRALQGDEALRPLLEDDVAGWLDANVALASAGGVDAPASTVRLHARLGLAVVRGLLLDLLATGEPEEVGAALELFALAYAGAWWAGQPAGAAGAEAGAGTSERAS